MGAALCSTDIFNHNSSFDSNFEVDEANPLGTGKFSVVHLCWRRNLPEKRYALKVISTTPSDHAALTRIYEEINILQVLGNQPSIIQLVDMDESMPNKIRLVLELCEGGELYDRIQQKQFYPEHEAKTLVKNLLDAVAFIHSKGIMHRDLKPENILLASKVSNTEIKISDFGLAKISKDFPLRLPRSHSICGSDFYLAPEVIKQEEYGREIDIWAVAVITYVVLSGSLPFFHNVLHKLYRQIVERDVSFPEQAWRSVSKGAQDFLLRLLQVRAGDRLTAEQSLLHPWLRGATGSPGNSFSSALTDVGGRPRPQHGQGHMGHSPHPLEHAHKVNSGAGPAQPATHQGSYVPTGNCGPQGRSQHARPNYMARGA